MKAPTTSSSPCLARNLTYAFLVTMMSFTFLLTTAWTSWTCLHPDPFDLLSNEDTPSLHLPASTSSSRWEDTRNTIPDGHKKDGVIGAGSSNGGAATLFSAVIQKSSSSEHRHSYKLFQDVWGATNDDVSNSIANTGSQSTNLNLPHKSNWLRRGDGGLGLSNAFANGENSKGKSNEYITQDHGIIPPEKNATIPRIIHKVYFQKDGKFDTEAVKLSSLKEAHKSWVDKNPGYELHYFNLDDARSYLSQHFHSIFLRAFDCLEAFAAKADFFRMAVLYREGGWYSDWKQVVLQQRVLDNLGGSGHFEFVATWDQGNHISVAHKCIQNALVGAIPQHPIVEETLVRILKNIKSTYYGQTALHSSSCCVFGDAWRAVVLRNNKILNHIKMGNFTGSGHFIFDNEVDNPFILHKCDGCGTGQNWKFGNNYNTLHTSKQYYCEDAPSIFNSHFLNSKLE